MYAYCEYRYSFCLCVCICLCVSYRLFTTTLICHSHSSLRTRFIHVCLHSFMPPSRSAADPGRRHGGLVVPGCAGLQRHHDYFPAADQSPGRDPHHHPSGAPPFRSCGGEVVQAMVDCPLVSMMSIFLTILPCFDHERRTKQEKHEMG